jgi:FkbM family methyltransferase
MKVVFVMRHSGYLRNFESTLRLMCDRGHTVHLALQIPGAHALLDAHDLAHELGNEYARFSRGAIPTRDDAWGLAARDLRLSLDYLRYLEPEYRHAPKLVARARRDAPQAFVDRLDQSRYRSRSARRILARGLRAQHDAIPTDPRIDGFLEAQQPDIVVLTPLIEPGAPQAEYVRSARALGIPTALCVASWDNLTNKGLIHGSVDLVTVWNEMMRREAVQLHGIRPERTAVTGAQAFDHWFTWQPSTTRAEFCRRVGLPAGRPYLLYVCSSKFIAPEEASFVRRWLDELRRSDQPILRQAGVLVRPHPQNADQWANVDLSDCGSVVVWPPDGEVPNTAASRSAYFDSIYHSAAVVGVNTTAEVESAIVGRGVFSLLAPEFSDTQEGTLHFEHLRGVGGGLLHVAATFDEHFAQLETVLAGPDRVDEKCRAFVDGFIRPFGRETPATPRLVDALERLSQHKPAPHRAPLWAALVRPHVQRTGMRLHREHARLVETKAEKSRRRKAAAPATPSPVARVKGAAPSWRAMAAAFRELDERHRVYFGRSIADSLPGELLQLMFEQAQPARLDYPDAEILLRVTSRSERNRLRACAKEPFTIEWIERSIAEGDVLYDIGANIGAYSLVAAKKPGGGARVFAFEPSYANLAALCANIVLNDVADQIIPLPFALSNSDAIGVLALRALEAGSARHTLEDDVASNTAMYRQPVMTFRLDELVDRFGLPQPNHIKLDVDGGELAVLDGAARILGSPTLQSVLVEIDTDLAVQVTEVLTRHGLPLRERVNVENKAGECRVCYGLFVRGTAADTPVREALFKFTAP